MKRLLFFAIFAFNGIVPAQVQNGVITGQVTGLDGKPAAGVRVAAAPPDDRGQISSDHLERITTTDGSGRYRLEDVPPGRYGIVAGAVGSPTYYPGTADATGAKTVTLAPGSTTVGLDFKLATDPVPRQVSGPGRPFPPGPPIQIAVRFVLDGKSPPADVVSDFRLSFNDRQNTTPAAYLQSSLLQSANLRVDISRSQNGGATLTAYSPAGAGATVGSGGIFQLPIFPGEYNLSVKRATPSVRLHDDYFLKAVSLGSIDLLTGALRVNGPVSGEILVTLGIGVQIAGNVRDESGAPQTNLEILLIPRSTPQGNPSAERTAVTDVQGNFLMRAVSPGDYQLFAWGALNPDSETPAVSVTQTPPAPMNLILRPGRNLTR